MAGRVGLSMSDFVGVLGLEEWRTDGNGDGDEGRGRERLREDAPANRLPGDREWVQLTGVLDRLMGRSIEPSALPSRNELAEV
jgi:hypothetical protein